MRPDLTVLRTEEKALGHTEADLYILGSDPLIVTAALPEEGYDPERNTFGPFSWAAEETEAAGNAAAEISGRSEQGRELTGILLAVFLVLLLIEMGVARYVG